MKSFERIQEIDTTTETGKVFLAALALLTAYDFNKKDNTIKCGEGADIDLILENMIKNASSIFETNISGEIDYDSCDEGILLKASIDILTCDVCKNGDFGSHRTPDYVLLSIKKYAIAKRRQDSIDSII